MTPFRLTCLGPPQLYAPNGDPISLRTQKNLALLAYLVIEPPTRLGRDRLAELLWPNADERDSRHSLATALSVLRGKVSSNLFESYRDSVRIQSGLIVTDIDDLLAKNRNDLNLLTIDVFLGDFMIHDSPSFAQWVDRERARLLPIIQNRLGNAISEARSNGDTEMMMLLAHRLRHFDLLSEPATRTLLEARAMEGDRLGGLGEYVRWCKQISSELGAVPSRDLSQLADRLRQNVSGHVVPARTHIPATEKRHTRPLIGRGREFQLCYEGWRRSILGFPSHSFVLGDPGVGRTSIAEKIAAMAALEGAHTIVLQSKTIDHEIPYSLLNQLVTQLVSLPGASATHTTALSILAQITSAVSERWPVVAPPSMKAGEEARVRLTDALIALISAVSDDAPIAIVIDDFHIADAASAAIVHSALNLATDIPVYALLTASLGGPEYSPMREDLIQHPDAVRAQAIYLNPLSRRESETLLENLFDGPRRPESSVARAILDAARGNPLALTLLATDWERSGSSALPFSLVSHPITPEAQIDNRFRSLISRLVTTLDEGTRRIAELASVLGNRLCELQFYSILELRPSQIMQGICTLSNVRILREVDGVLVFSNELVRRECYQRLAAPVRLALHSDVADKLKLVDTKGAAVDRLEIAWHLVRANRSEEAVEYLLTGGLDAIRRGAPHEAELALAMSSTVLSGVAREEATSLQAEALQELGRWEDSLRVLGIPDSSIPFSDEPWREVLRAVARRWCGDQNTRHLISTTSGLLEIAGAQTSSKVRAGAVSALPYFLSHTHDRQGLASMGQILSNLEVDGFTPYELAQVLLSRAWWLERECERCEAAQVISRAEEIIRNEGIGSTLAARVALGDGMLNSLNGRYQDAIPHLLRAAAIAKRIENPIQIASASASLATAYGRIASYDLQIEWARSALATLPPTDCSLIAIAASYELALGLEFLGRTSEALRASDGLALRNHRGSPPWAAQAILLMQADIASMVGDDRGAHRFARKAIDYSQPAPLNSDLFGPYARWLAKTSIRAGCPQEALTQLKRDDRALSRLHCKDQGELLASQVFLEDACGLDSTESRQRLEAKLQSLPAGVHTLLRRLGFIQLLASATFSSDPSPNVPQLGPLDVLEGLIA